MICLLGNENAAVVEFFLAFFHFSAPKLRGRSVADYAEFIKLDQKIGALLKNFGGQNIEIWDKLRTTSQIDREYLRK